MAGPIEQFEIKPILHLPELFVNGEWYNLSFTNSAAAMFLAVALVGLAYYFSLSRRAVVPGRWQSMAEITYEFVQGIVLDNTGKAGLKYFPYIMALFLFVLFCNLVGMIPFSFTATSHIIVTFGLAIFVFTLITMIGLFKQGPIKFFAHFIPEGLPLWIAPLVFAIELVSFLSRPISLSIRLAANMMAGHTLLKVIAGFIGMLGVWGVAPLAFVVLLTGFEIFVAILQAYIFTLLTCMYLSESVAEAH